MSYITSAKDRCVLRHGLYKYYSKKGWISWGDFLGTGRIQDNQRQFLSFNEAKKIVHKENINSVKEWKLYCKNKPYNIPAKPWKIYKNEWINMSDWLNGFSCGSNGEYLVEEYLKKLKVSFKKQYSFDGCLSEKNHKLFFDFYLNELNICIEYDGKQHFEPVEFFGGKKIFNDIKNRDQLKNKFCKDNGIFLLRIPYNKNNDEIEEIIINVINNGKSF